MKYFLCLSCPSKLFALLRFSLFSYRMTIAAPHLSGIALFPRWSASHQSGFQSAPRFPSTLMPTRTACLSKLARKATRRVTGSNLGGVLTCSVFCWFYQFSFLLSVSGGSRWSLPGAGSTVSEQGVPHQRKQNV